MKNYDTHEKNSIILMKIGGLMSMTASYLIMRDIYNRHKRGERVKLTSRIVYELSLANFWASFFDPVLSTWMAPPESEAFMATGTVTTCNVQGFFDNFLYGTSVCMNALLAVTYCILAKFGRKDRLRSKRSQWLALGLPPLIMFVLALMPLFNQAYNYTDGHVCSIGPRPMSCLAEVDIECTRGEDSRRMKITRFSFVFTANIIIVISVLILIHSLAQKERRMMAKGADNRNQRVYSTQKTWQGIWYIAAFMISWGPWYVWQFFRITADAQVEDAHSAALIYILALTMPTQGVWNALVYFRPQYLKYRERDSSELKITSLCRVIGVRIPRCCIAEWRQSLISYREEEDVSVSHRESL